MSPELKQLLADPDAFVLVREVAQYWRCEEGVVYRQIAKGALRARRFGRLVRIQVRDLQEYGTAPQ